MVKYICSIVLILNLSSGSEAQLKSYGLKFGASLSNESWNYTNYSYGFSPESRWGITLGGFIELFEHLHLSLITEADLIQKGISETFEVTTVSEPDGTGEFITLRPRIDYLSILALGKARVELSGFSPYAIVGPRIDVVLNKAPDGFQAVIDGFNTVDVGVTLGVGTQLNFLPVRVLAEFRFSPNLTDSYRSQFLSIRANSIELLLGIALKK
jgi:hypothetical protein